MNNFKKGYVRLPRTVLFDNELGFADKVVYCAIRSHEGKKGTFPAIETIRKELNCSASTAKRAITLLQKLGHMTWKRGGPGRPNRYIFPPIQLTDGPSIGSPVTRTDGTHDPSTGSGVNHKQESVNKNQKQEWPGQLYHGRDRAFVKEDGTILIKRYDGKWVNYGGGDDGSFRLGRLTGTEARRAAENQKTRKANPSGKSTESYPDNDQF